MLNVVPRLVYLCINVAPSLFAPSILAANGAAATTPPRPVAAFTHALTCHRQVAGCATLEECRARCLRGWAVDNLGLPWFVPKPVRVRCRGDQATGAGLEVTRVPPAGLREGILDVVRAVDGCGNEDLTVVYKVLNPGWWTFPVEDHCGWIRFYRRSSGEGSDDKLLLEWTVKWTPLSIPVFQRQWETALEAAIRYVIETASDYMAATTQAVETR